MHFTTYLVILAIIAASASAQFVNVTSPTQDYFLLSQRKLRNDIYVSELKISNVDARGAGNIKLLADQQQVVLQEIDRVEQSLIPLQALSPIRKYCVQKYKPQLITWDVAQKEFATCLSAAQTRVNSLTSTPKSNLNSAKTVTNTNLPKAVAACNTTHVNNTTKLEECVLTAVETHTKSVDTYLNTVDKALETSICTLNDLSRDAVRCSFLTERKTLVTIGSVLDLIENCITVEEESCNCASPNSTSVQTGASLKSIILGTNVK